MFGTEITISIFLIAILQFLLLPFQVINYLVRKSDKTRLRFLILVITYTAFNSMLIVYLSVPKPFSFISIIFAVLMEIGIIGYTVYYILIEMGLEDLLLKRKLFFFVPFIISYKLTPIFLEGAAEFFVQLLLIVLIEIISAHFIWMMIRKMKVGRNLNSPIYNCALISSGIGFLLPLLILFSDDLTLYVLTVNLIFFVVSFTYLKQYFIQMKIEHRFVSDTFASRFSNLNDQYQLNDEFFSIPDLTTREQEISKFILLNYSYKEIAEMLIISSSSVRKHASNIFRKVGVETLQQYREKFSKDEQN